MENVMRKNTYTRKNDRLYVTEVFIGNKLVGHFNANDELSEKQFRQIEDNILKLIATNQVTISQRPAYDPEADDDEEEFDIKV
jgi:hypothetical protein